MGRMKGSPFITKLYLSCMYWFSFVYIRYAYSIYSIVCMKGHFYPRLYACCSENDAAKAMNVLNVWVSQFWEHLRIRCFTSDSRSQFWCYVFNAFMKCHIWLHNNSCFKIQYRLNFVPNAELWSICQVSMSANNNARLAAALARLSEWTFCGSHRTCRRIIECSYVSAHHRQPQLLSDQLHFNRENGCRKEQETQQG